VQIVWISAALKVGPIGSSETSLIIYKNTRCHDPTDNNFNFAAVALFVPDIKMSIKRNTMQNLMLIWPCIVIYYFNKTNHMHKCIKFILFGVTLYIFRTVFPSIIRSPRLYIQQPNWYCCLLGSKLASSQQYLFDICLLLYEQSWTPDDGRKDLPKYVESHPKIKWIWHTGASSWFCYRNTIQKLRRSIQGK